MITRPLDLESRLSPPPRDFSAVAWVNVGLVVLFFSLLGSRFVLAPGMLVELPKMDGSLMTAVETSALLNYRRESMIVFGTGIYTLTDIQIPLTAYAKAHPGSTLQVIADKQVSSEALLRLGDIAAAAGFKNILVSGERADESAPGK